MAEIKPCPFCGGKSHIRKLSVINFTFIWCEDCCAQGPRKPSTEDAIAAWNKRVKEGEE